MTATHPEARHFVALPLFSDLGARLGLLAERALGRAAFRLARPEGLHLTLFFLGRLESERHAALADALRVTLAGLPAPLLCLRGSGAFPDLAKARVLWVGVEERAHPGRLAACHLAVLEGARQAGIDTSSEERRPLQPHITVARPLAGRVPVPAVFLELDSEHAWDPEFVTLFESRPAPGGSLFTPLASWPLVVSE